MYHNISRTLSERRRFSTVLNHIGFAVVLLSFGVGLSAQSTNTVPGQYSTIQTAVLFSNSGDTILVSPGVYSESINYLGKALIIQSAAGPDQTTISGSGSSRVVTIGTGVPNGAVLDGFTITGGDGGILIRDCSPVVMNCIIENNATSGDYGGGGILIETLPGIANAPNIQDCVIRSNSSNQGGGGVMVDIYDDNAGMGSCFPLITRCGIHDNVALGYLPNSCVGIVACPSYGGGGVLCRNRNIAGLINISITQCDLFNNSASGPGGGLSVYEAGTATVRSCKIFNNESAGSSGNGSGIYVLRSNATVENTAIVRNETINGSSSSGAAFYSHLFSSTGPNYSLNVRNCTIADNVGSVYGGFYTTTSTQNATVESTVIWGNYPFDFGSPAAASATQFNFCNLGVGLFPGNPGNLSVDPLFADAPNGDYHLSRSSPLIDAGDPFAATGGVIDIDGGNRLVGPRVDIGADEVPVAALPGSNEDLEMHSWIVGGNEDPNDTIVPLVAGDVLALRLTSAGDTFVGTPPLVAGQSYTTGTPPLSPLPGIHLDGFGGITIVYGDPSGAFLMGPSLPFGGVILVYSVPPGLSGFSFRLQGFAVTSLAANGMYAVTEAHDLKFL